MFAAGVITGLLIGVFSGAFLTAMGFVFSLHTSITTSAYIKGEQYFTCKENNDTITITFNVSETQKSYILEFEKYLYSEKRLNNKREKLLQYVKKDIEKHRHMSATQNAVNMLSKQV